MVDSRSIASRPTSNTFRRASTAASRMSSAGPEAKAVARKRGASTAVIQAGRAAKPA